MVCGLRQKTANTKVIPCTTAVDCPNILHTTCLSNTTLDCGELMTITHASIVTNAWLTYRRTAQLPKTITLRLKRTPSAPLTWTHTSSTPSTSCSTCASRPPPSASCTSTSPSSSW
ncbi:hypothetical protein GWK47_009215 [Chionoecetes opilio]|uniref:Uncharacterized protein n=1 Tax=Chionoecetes opilio TaxID=41210 RepID=A0A8J5CPR3_CHIOP|nr:hypothetical protein GWK47_009215 [Chionoecetes opilio]